MALCGSVRACQCAIGAADIGTDGEVSGTYPNITMLGDGSSAIPWQPQLSTAWVTAVVAAFTPVPWIALPLLNSWGNAGGANQVAQYRKIGDIVYVRGIIANGVVTGQPSQFTTMPVGYRPVTGVILTSDHNNQRHARIDVGADGSMIVRYAAGGDNGYLTLSFIFSTLSGND